MKHSGDQEEGTQAHAVHPGSDPLPAVVWQTMQQRHAHEGRHNEELQRNHRTIKKKKNNLFEITPSTFKTKPHAAHRMSVAVCSVLIAGGLIAAVSRGPSVHEPETHTDKQNKK